MKKFAVFLIFIIFLAGAGWGQNYKWTGAANDGDWINPANWETGGPITETIDGQLVTLTYSVPPANTIWTLTGGGGGNNYFVINDVNGNAVPYPPGSLGVDNLVIQSGSLKLDVDGQFDNLIIEGGTFIRNGGFLKTATIKMTSGILDLNGMGNIDIPPSGWDITGGIIIRDDVNNYSQAPPTINNDNVIDIGGPSSGGGGGGKDNFIWTGGADTDWDNTDNWVGGDVPVLGNTIKIIINSSTSPDTNIPSTITCNSLVIAVGANFDLNDDLEIYSLLDNKGTFICNNGTVTLFGTITVKGNNEFYNLDCTNAAVEFESGKTQTITNELTADGANLRAINNSVPHWKLDITPSNVLSTPASIGECSSTYFLDWLTSIPPVTDGGNNINVFIDAASGIYEWEGTTNTNWTTGSNWLGNVSPGDGDPAYTIIIQSPSTHYPIFSGTGLICSNLIIETGASLDMGNYNLTVLDELENNGNLVFAGTGGQIVDLTTATITANETVTYDSNGGHFAGLINFNNLTIQSGARTGVGVITVSGNFRQEGGSLNAASINVDGTSYIAGNITTTAAQTYTGNVTLGGAGGTTWILQGTTVTLGVITGASKFLTIVGDGVLNGGSDIINLYVTGDFTLNSSALSMQAQIYINGTSIINQDITAVNQVYTGKVTLGDDVALTANFVALNETDGAGYSLTINGNAEFYDDVDNIATLLVTGTSIINADITTTGNQTFTGAITISGSNPLILTSGGDVQTSGVVSGTIDITIEADNDIKIGTVGIDVTGFVVTLKAGGDIDIQGPIKGYQMTAIASGDVKLGSSASISVTSIGNHSSSPGDGTGAAIYIEANDFIPTSTNSITTGTAGSLCLELVTAYPSDNFDNYVVNGTCHIHNIITIVTDDLVYYDHNLVPPLSGFSSSAVYIPDNDPQKTFIVSSGNNIYIVDVDNNLNLIFTTGSAEFIEFRGTNKFTGTLTLNTGSGGIRFVDTDIELAGNFIVNNNEKLTLDGIAGSSIEADGITLNDISSGSAEDLTLKATSGNINLNGQLGTAGSPLGSININGAADINIKGSITGDQLTVIAVGDVNVGNNVTILVTGSGDHDTLPGNGLNAAIYVQATDFKPIFPNSITPGTGEFCLNLVVAHPLNYYDSYVVGVDVCHIHNVGSGTSARNLVYYNSIFTTAVEIRTIFTPNADYDFIDSSDLAIVYNAEHDKNIIIYEIGGNKDVTFTIDSPSPTGSIIIYGKYSADNLTLNPGTGGVRLINAEIEIKLGNFSITAAPLILAGTTESSIKAKNIILDNVIVNGTDRITLEAADKISVVDADSVAVSFGGGIQTAPVEISVSGELGNVIIKQGSYIEVKAGDNITQANQKTLELKNNAVLDVSSGSWQIGSGTPVLNGFTGYYGALRLGGDSELITYNFNLAGASPNMFTVHNSGWSAVSVIGDEVNIGTSVNLRPAGSDYAKFIIKMDGNGNQDLTTAQILGSLHIGNQTQVYLHDNLRLSGEISIKNTSSTKGVLDAGSYNITLFADISGEQKTGFTNPVVGRWKVEGVTETISSTAPVSTYPMSNAFRQNTGGFVEFRKGMSNGQIFFEITGNTVWQKFICREPGAIIQFSMHPDQHIFLDTFEAKGASSNHITLTRYIDPDDIGKTGWSIIYNNTYVPDGAADGSSIDYSLPAVPAMNDMKSEPAPYTELSKFWNFNLILTGAPGYNPLDVENLDVYFSHAWNQQIPISSTGVNLVPFYKSAGTNPRKGYFNYDWGNEGRTIIYSFAEDGNGNGKVDRIRVQTNVRLNADFRNFNVEVNGYKIDTSRGQAAVYAGVSIPNGFDLVSRITGDPADDSSFYIYIEENDMFYDGKPINWRVIKNINSLKDSVTQILAVGDQKSGEVYTTTNTIPPRVSFALTLPEYTQTFVQMSQPVSAYGGTLTIDGNRRIGTQGYTIIDGTPSGQLTLEYYPFEEAPKQYSVSVPNGIFNFLLELDSPPAAASLANLPPIGMDIPDEYFTMQGLKGLEVRAIDWNDPLVDPDSFSRYPPPRYPVDWNYSGYAEYSGNSHIPGLSPDNSIINTTPVFLPPFELLTPEMMRRLEIYAADIASGISPSVLPVTPGSFASSTPDELKRRSTDVLVSITPPDSAAPNYFAWPVWARYNTSSSGVVWDFDGTNYLEDSDKNDIAIQVRLFNSSDFSALGYNGLSLFYGFEVPAEWRNPAAAAQRGKSTGGLWLPTDSSNNINPLFNIVPDKTVDVNTGHIGFYPAHRAFGTASGSLFTFDIQNGNFSNGGKVEFVLRLEGNNDDDPYLFVARLDAPPGVIPGNWYRLIRPFSFDIMNVRQQRGGVTILNNVINSDKKEMTYINYNLPRSGRVTVQIYTLDGTLIKSIRRNEQREAGAYVDSWDGSNNGGRPVARGMYFVRVVGPDIDEIRKIMVVK
jgi:hypothetical protein